MQDRESESFGTDSLSLSLTTLGGNCVTACLLAGKEKDRQ